MAQACQQSEHFRVFNPIAAHLEAKSLLAELSRHAADPGLAHALGLNEDEREAVQRRLAWSRLLAKGPATTPESASLMDLVRWVKERPEALVVKSSFGYGGHGIFIGSSFQDKGPQDRARQLLGVTHDVSWPLLIDFLLTQGTGQWIIQKKMSGRRMRHRSWVDGQLLEKISFVDCSIFTNSGVSFQPRGGACRFSEDAIVNIGQGGGLMPLLLESEQT